MQANYAFHDVIYPAAAMPLVERLAKGARRTFIGDRVWSARARARRALREERSPAPRDPRGDRGGERRGRPALAREHVLSSGRLIEVVIESVGSGGSRDPSWGS